jgi:hypothetical protein
MNELPTPWGNSLKSNSNGTYFGLSIENVNRNSAGFVDFEKFVRLDGIAMVDVVANLAEAALTGHKARRRGSRIMTVFPCRLAR